MSQLEIAKKLADYEEYEAERRRKFIDRMEQKLKFKESVHRAHLRSARFFVR